MADFESLGGETVDIWDQNADYWDERMGEGNEFHKFLIEPTQLCLLALKSGERALDIACGNGQFARKMASLGADVTAVDAAPRMIENARRRMAPNAEYAERLRYKVVDASDEEAMLSLGESIFDAAVCTMALMDIASISPISRAVRRLLKADGRFVFSVMHPCFNSTEGFRQTMEQEDRNGEIVERLSVSVTRYIEPHRHKGLAMRGQPVAQNYFHRPWNIFRHPEPSEMLSPLSHQLAWLVDAGFEGVDCFWLQAGYAVFGGYKGCSERENGLSFEDAMRAVRAAIGANIRID